MAPWLDLTGSGPEGEPSSPGGPSPQPASAMSVSRSRLDGLRRSGCLLQLCGSAVGKERRATAGQWTLTGSLRRALANQLSQGQIDWEDFPDPPDAIETLRITQRLGYMAVSLISGSSTRLPLGVRCQDHFV